MITLTREQFNASFDAEVVVLPRNMIAYGFNKGRMYVYNECSAKCLKEMPWAGIRHRSAETFSRFWVEEIHPYIVGKEHYYFILCYADGGLERTEFCVDERKPFAYDVNKFADKFEIGDIDCKTTPILHKHRDVFCFAGQKNDPLALLVPDSYFLEKWESKTFEEIDKTSIPFEDRDNRCIFRGKSTNGNELHFVSARDRRGKTPRQFLAAMDLNEEYFDVKDDFMTQADQAKYKYILDIDGHTNAWDGLRWKLYSGSVVLKHIGVYEQWYYKELHPFVHYVPVKNDFSDLVAMVEWCRANQSKCLQISRNARAFKEERLDYSTVVGEFRERMVNYFRNTSYRKMDMPPELETLPELETGLEAGPGIGVALRDNRTALVLLFVAVAFAAVLLSGLYVARERRRFRRPGGTAQHKD
jgi:hypothetical protein